MLDDPVLALAVRLLVLLVVLVLLVLLALYPPPLTGRRGPGGLPAGWWLGKLAAGVADPTPLGAGLGFAPSRRPLGCALR